MGNVTSIATQEAVTAKRKANAIERKTKKAIEKKTTALRALKVDYMETLKLLANPYNPNRQTEHDFELLLNSIEEDGFTQPIVATVITKEHLEDAKLNGFKEGDVVIVDGEHRWRAAQTLKLATVPVVLTDMRPAQMRIATLRHNRARGSEDMTLAADVLRDLQELGAMAWAKDSLMLSDEEINRLLEEASAADKLAGDEYSEAWQPTDKMSGADNGDATDLGASTASTTAAAVEARREMEAKLQQAKTDEEKAMIRKDSDVLRL